MPKIYFDNNATTPLLPEVAQAICEVQEKCFGNPSSVHWAGREAKKYLNLAREKIASLLGVGETELLFTSGGTESINTALRGIFERRPSGRDEIISSPLEHQATLKTLEYLQSRGAQITFLNVDRQGRMDPEELQKKITSKTLLVSLMFANNELGNLYPIKTFGEICREKKVFFHCDGVQAFGKLPLSLKNTPVDLFSFSAHKCHGPKGVGGLYVREGVKISPLHHGGRQEKSLRGGTENVAGIYGMAIALEKALEKLDQNTEQISLLRDRLEKQILSQMDGVFLNGDLEHRLPNTSNFLVEGVDGESLLFNLDLEGVAASAGSACESGSLDPSHVLLAMGYTPEQAKASIRFSLSKWNTEKEVDECINSFLKIVKKLRKSPLSPLPSGERVG